MWFKSPAWDSVTYWALDLETGGLDQRRDPILAVGMVPVRGGIIRLAESWRSLVCPEPDTNIAPESVRAHHLVRAEVAAAPPLAAVLPEVERRLGEGVLLVHEKAIDVGFLKRDFRRCRLKWPAPPVVDTVDLLLKAGRFRSHHHTGEKTELNLVRARRAWGLPAYSAHDPLTDAIAAAELFLVVRQALGAKTLRELR